MSKVLSMITLAAENYTIDIIKDTWNYFDKIIVVDGDYERGSQKYIDEINTSYSCDYYYPKKEITDANYSMWKWYSDHTAKDTKLWVVYRPWNDNYAEAYMTHLNLLNEGDWVLIVDSDEFPGELLKKNIDLIIENSADGENYDIVMLPVVDFVDDKPLWKEEDVPHEYISGMWTKHILLRKGKDPIQLRYFGSHVIPVGSKYTYYPFPYHHKKKWESFIDNEIYQWVLCPEGQLVSTIDAAIFKTAINRAGIKSMADMKSAVLNGTLSPEIEILSVKNRDKRRDDGSLHPWAQLYCSYYLLHDNGKYPPDEKYTLEGIRKEIIEWKTKNHTYKNYGCTCSICRNSV